MVETQAEFAKRIQTLGRKHADMTKGYTTVVSHDGLLTAVPKRRVAAVSSGRLKFLVLVAIGFFGFKGFVLAVLGPLSYKSRLEMLEQGTVFEQAGAKVLVIDPLTHALAEVVGPILR